MVPNFVNDNHHRPKLQPNQPNLYNQSGINMNTIMLQTLDSGFQQAPGGLYPYMVTAPSTPMGTNMPSILTMHQQPSNLGPILEQHQQQSQLINSNINGLATNSAPPHYQQTTRLDNAPTLPPDTFNVRPVAITGGDQRTPAWASRPLVTIPKFSHSTIQTVLDINKQLIKILIDYQNCGWFQEQEFKLYQARLQTNIAYLIAAQDFIDSERAPPKNVTVPDLSPVALPDRLKILRGNQLPLTANTKITRPEPENSKDKSSTISTESILASINPPAMIRDQNPTNQLNPSTYTPVQPFVLPQSNECKFPIPPHLNPLPLVSTTEASLELTKRIAKGPCTLPSEQRSLRTAKDEEDATNELKENVNKSNNAIVVDEGADDDPQDEDYVPGPDEDESADGTAVEGDTDLEATTKMNTLSMPLLQQCSNRIEKSPMSVPAIINIPSESTSEIDFNTPRPEGLHVGSPIMSFDDDLLLDGNKYPSIMTGVSDGEFGMGLDLNDIFGQGM